LKEPETLFLREEKREEKGWKIKEEKHFPTLFFPVVKFSFQWQIQSNPFELAHSDKIHFFPSSSSSLVSHFLGRELSPAAALVAAAAEAAVFLVPSMARCPKRPEAATAAANRPS
jgi:hypothetical protein